MLENLYRDSLALMERMRDYVREDAHRDRAELTWSDRTTMIRVNRMLTVRLCHAFQLVQAHQARLAGDLEAAVPPRIRLESIPVDLHRSVLSPRLAALADAANHLFERLHAVHLAIYPEDASDIDPLPPAALALVANDEDAEDGSNYAGGDDEDRIYA